MKLEQSFEVQAPIDQVWAALVDIERVAPCLPGASVTGRNDDGTYNGTFTIKIGPTTASYTGKLEMQSIDESSHTATMHAQGADKRGQGGATATISSRLSPLDGSTRVDVDTDYHITGRLARFGRGGMIEDISERLLREFASRLQASLTYSGGQTGEPASGEALADEPLAPAPIEDATSEQPTAETPRATQEPGAAWVPGGRAPDRGVEAAAPTEVALPQEPEPSEPEPATEPSRVEGPAEPLPPPPPPETPAPPPHAEAPPPPPPHAAPPPPPPPPPRPSEPSEPVEGLSLVGSVLVQRIKRNPVPAIGVIGGLLLLRMIFRRR